MDLFYIPTRPELQISEYFMSMATPHAELDDSYVHVMATILYTWLGNI